MKRKLLFVVALAASALGFNAHAQTDVTETYIKNAQLTNGKVISVGVCTYDYDEEKNGTTFSQLVDVTDWNAVNNGNGKAGGIFSLTNPAFLGGMEYKSPTSDADGNSEGNILGLVTCWSASAQYTQDVTLPAGTYTLVLSVFNSAGANAATKNLIGFVANSGKEYLAKTTQYPIGKWTYEFINISLSEETAGKWSLGYTSPNAGSASCPHLFFSPLTLFEGTIDETAYAEQKELNRTIKLAETTLADDKYAGYDEREIKVLQAALDAAKTATKDKYKEAAAALQSAIDAFRVSPTYVPLLEKEIEKARDLGMDVTSYENNTTTSASVLVNEIKVDEYNYVSTNYAYGVDLGKWNTDGPVGSKKNQHWSGEEREYLEQSDAAYGSDNWKIKYDQDLTLPKGSYVFKVAGRKAKDGGVTLTLTVTKDGENIGFVDDFPEGDTGLGINKAGATSFDPEDEAGFANNGTGRGFEWRYVRFTLDEEATVNIAVDANATQTSKWVSFCDATVQTTNEATAALIEYNKALKEAKSAIANDTYKNVIGKEYADLKGAIDGDETLDKTSKEAVEEATADLNAFVSAFIAAKAAYDPHAAAISKERTKAEQLGMNEKVEEIISETTAENVGEFVHTLKVAEYEYVSTNYAYGVDLGRWNTEGPVGSLYDQHWSGERREYFEQSTTAHGSDNWKIKYYQDLTLPKGSYVFKVAGRKAKDGGVTLTLTVTKDGENIGFVDDFPEGDTGLGINKAGATSFDPADEAGFANNGTGRGFEWRYVRFTLDEEATVNIAVDAEATQKNKWVSFCDATVQTNNEAVVSWLEYHIAIEDAKKTIGDSNYENVGGKERADLKDAIENTLDDASDNEYQEAIAELKNLVDAFTAAKTQYDTLVKYQNEEKTRRSANIGNGAFQIKEDVEDELWTALESAQSEIKNYEVTESSTAAGIQALLTAYENADVAYNEVKLNEPEDGTRFTIASAEANHALAGNVVTIAKGETGDNNKTGYVFSAKDNSVDVNLAQAFIFENARDEEHPNYYYISIETEDGIVYLTNGTNNGSAAGWASQQIQGNTSADSRLAFEIIPLWTEEGFNLKNTGCTKADEMFVAIQDGGAMYTENGNNAIKFEEAVTATVDAETATLAPGKFATRIYPFEPQIEGVKFYSCGTVEGSYLKLDEVTKPEANVPYILYNDGEEAVSIAASGYGTLYAVPTTVKGNMLTGVYTNVTVGAGNYVLQTQSSKQGFYQIAEGSSITAIPYRCYLTLPETSETPGDGSYIKAYYFRFGDDDATAIESVVEIAEEEGAAPVFYNLSGQRVNNPTKGIYIVNGKKVLVK